MITGIHHATFLTANLVKSRAFYESVLGLRPDPKRPLMSYDGVWYDVAPSQQIHLMLLPDPEAGLQRPAHPQGVRRGCTKGRQSTTQQAACGIDTKGLKPQQHTQHGGRDRHVAMRVRDLPQLIARLNAAGVTYSVSQSGRRALFCRDPDQNALEFIEVAE